MGGVPDGAVPDGGVPPVPPDGGVPDGRVPFICIPAGGVPEGRVPFICRPADGVPEGWVVLPCISAGCVPEGVPAVEPEDASVACWPEGFAACAVAVACAWPEDADVLPLSCVQPAINIPATRIADAMIMMIVLFFMRCVSPYFSGEHRCGVCGPEVRCRRSQAVPDLTPPLCRVPPVQHDIFRGDHPLSELS